MEEKNDSFFDWLTFLVLCGAVLCVLVVICGVALLALIVRPMKALYRGIASVLKKSLNWVGTPLSG